MKILRMVIRNQIASLIYRLALFALGIASLCVAGISDSVLSPLNTFRNFGSVLTLVSSILVSIEIVANAISLAKNGVHRLAAGVYPPVTFVLLSLEVGFLFSHPLSSFLSNSSYFSSNGDITYVLLLSILFPIAYLLDWLLFGEKGTVKAVHLIEVAALPLLYYLISLFNHLIRGETFSYATAIFEPKNFLANSNVPLTFSENDGWNGVAISCFSVLGIYLASASLLLLLSNVLAGKVFKNN